MSVVDPNIKLQYAKNWKQGPNGFEWNEAADVIFAEPREIFTENVWRDGGNQPQQFVRVLNADIWGGKIRYPFESEFKVVE